MSFDIDAKKKYLLNIIIKIINTDVKHLPLVCQEQINSYSGMKIFLIKLLSQGFFSTRDKSCLMEYILRRIIANMPAALYRYALALLSTGQCAAAIIHLNRSIIQGHLPSCATKAWILINSRDGVANKYDKAFYLVEKGARLGCHRCKEVIYHCRMHWERWN
jgi:TPR repeat protein